MKLDFARPEKLQLQKKDQSEWVIWWTRLHAFSSAEVAVQMIAKVRRKLSYLERLEAATEVAVAPATIPEQVSQFQAAA